MVMPMIPMCYSRTAVRRPIGFTLIEMLVVMATLGLLLAIVAPKYSQHVDRARDAVLRHNLRGLRDVLDKYYGDRGRFPAELQELVSENYLRELPLDPVTQRSDTWVPVAPRAGQLGAVGDVRSGAPGKGSDGTDYASW
jgi:general secretion pathway protein G